VTGDERVEQRGLGAAGTIFVGGGAHARGGDARAMPAVPQSGRAAFSRAKSRGGENRWARS
jgi:hypothetical protein